MHLGNGAITPECAALTYTAAAAGLAASAVVIQPAGLTREKLQLAAGLGCLVFAAQAINMPVAAGTSAHLVGGVLLAWLLGPGLGAWTMTAVLVVQALALGDGGVMALGANVLNMAILPAAMIEVAGRLAQVRCRSPQTSSVGLTAALAIPLAAGLIVGETALFRPLADLASFGDFAVRILVVHLWIGVLEGAATFAIISCAHSPVFSSRFAGVRPGVLGLACGLVLFAALALPFSSSLPDGYEAAAQASGLGWLLAR